MITNNSINSKISMNNVYVSVNGNNTSGTGSIIYPFATIAHALSTITTASSSNPFTIIVTTGSYTEASIALKPWVYLDGQNSTLRITTAMTVDSSFSTGGNIFICNFQSIAGLPGTINLDFSVSGGNLVNLYLYDIEEYFSASCSFTGSPGNTIIFTDNFVTTVSPTITNCGINFKSSNFNFIIYNVNTTSAQYNSFITNCIANELTVTSDGVPTTNLTVLSTNIVSSITLAGANTDLYIDVASVTEFTIPVASGGAFINYLNVADALPSNYSPTNYTPANASVKGNIQGIDNQFALITGSYSTSVPAIVATTGWTTMTLGFSLLHRIDNIVTMSVTLAGTPSATNQALQVLVPFTNVFPTQGLASGTGTMFLTSSPSATAIAFINSIFSVSADRYVQINSTCLGAGVGVAFTMQVVFSYQIQ